MRFAELYRRRRIGKMRLVKVYRIGCKGKAEDMFEK